MTDLISVVVPTYNRGWSITECLDSIHGNTHRPIEVVVVDDGSTDDTEAKVRGWVRGKIDDRFHLKFIRQDKRGVSAARNTGLDKVTGGFVAFLDSDDLYLPDALSTLVKPIIDKGANHTYGKTEQVEPTGRVVSVLGKDHGNRVSDIPDHNWHISGLMIRTRLAKDIGGFREDLGYSEDWEFATRVKARGGNGHFIGRAVSRYRLHLRGQITGTEKRIHPAHRERAIGYCLDLLRSLPENTRAAEQKCGFLLFRNALRFLKMKDYAACKRNIRLAAACSKPAYKILFRVSGPVVPALYRAFAR